MTRISFGEVADKAVAETALSAAAFGGNYLFVTHGKGARKGIGDGGFDEAAEYIGLSHFRYPGGTIAEELFDPANPDASLALVNHMTGHVYDNPRPITPMSEFLAYAESVGGKVTLVVPTLRYAEDYASGDAARIAAVEAEIRGFVEGVMSGSYAHLIETFEIGNEYVWGGINSDLSNITARDYGAIADSFARLMQETFDATEFDPLISVQSTVGKWGWHDHAALDQFSAAGLDAIDAVTAHLYRSNVLSKNFEKNMARDIGYADRWSDAAGRELEVIVSEWNANDGEVGNGVLLPISTAMMRMFNAMAAEGVERAHVWPIIQNTCNELVDHRLDADNIDGYIRLAGELYTQMNRHLDGLHVIDNEDAIHTDGDGDIDYFLHGYASAAEHRAVFVISSLQPEAETVTLDLSDALESVLCATTPGAATYTDVRITFVSADGDPLARNVLGQSHEVDVAAAEGAAEGDGIFQLELNACDVAFVELRGVMCGTAGDDVITGTDRDDTIEGGGGADLINGGEGFDFISFASADVGVKAKLGGGAVCDGDARGDVYESIEGVLGSAHTDALYGDGESNVIEGGAGGDRLYGRGGDDVLDGGAQCDVLFGNGGADIISGGEGRDRFVFFRTADTGVGAGERDVIADFEADLGERLEIRRFDADLTQRLKQFFDFIGEDEFSGQAGELRFFRDGGETTLVQGDQTGDGVADFEIELTGDQALTEANFLI